MLSRFARGDDVASVIAEDMEPKIKSVGNSTTTAHDMVTLEDTRIALYGLCESVASRMRRGRVVGRVVQLSIRNVTLDWYQRQRRLSFDTASSFDFFQTSYELLLENWRPGTPLRSLGVSVSALSNAGELMQLSFLPEDALRQKHQILEETVDHIRERYGHFAIQRAIMLSDPALRRTNPEGSTCCARTPISSSRCFSFHQNRERPGGFEREKLPGLPQEGPVQTPQGRACTHVTGSRRTALRAGREPRRRRVPSRRCKRRWQTDYSTSWSAS
jgi:hypothetical protein